MGGAGNRRCRNGMQIMSVPAALMMGIVAGIVLFFVLQRTGVIDHWLERMER